MRLWRSGFGVPGARTIRMRLPGTLNTKPGTDTPHVQRVRQLARYNGYTHMNLPPDHSMVTPTYIIAEAGVNHNGSLEMGKRLVDVAADAGANAVKFQTFRANALATLEAPKAEYQRGLTDAGESQWEMLRALELSPSAHYDLITHCERRGIQFLSTPFDTESAIFLARTLDLPRIKLPSGEITNGPLLYCVAGTGKPVILSTGMSTLGEVEDALGVLALGYLNDGRMPSYESFQAAYASPEGMAQLQAKVILLHCTTEYPAPFVDVNLRAMDTLRDAFGLPVGYSDHTPGISISIAAVARGAVVVEKHFTLDRSLPGPDHKASLEPGELVDLVRAVRHVESALGSGRKYPASAEIKNRPIARKSLVAATTIDQGESFSAANLQTKRPGTGISPMAHWGLIGQQANRTYKPDEQIDP